MVSAKPLRWLHYNLEYGRKIRDFVTLPYDIITKEKQDEYYRRSENNFVRIVYGRDLKGDQPRDKYVRAKDTLESWLSQGVLVEDEMPSMFIYEDEYVVNGERRRQAGLVALVKVEPFEEGNIFPHEQVYEKPLKDRLALLRETESCLEMIISLIKDEERVVLELKDRYVKTDPLIEFEDEEALVHRIWKIGDNADIEAVVESLREDQVIIADGHHRYTTALNYWQETKDESKGYILMLLWSMKDDVKVLPTHRLIRFKKKVDVLERLKHFDVKEVGSGLGGLFEEMGKIQGHVFGLYDGGYHLVRIPEKYVDKPIDSAKSDAWNRLDVNILRSVIEEESLCMDIGKSLEDDCLAFVKDPETAVKKVDEGEYDVAFFLNPTKLEDVEAVVTHGEVMPQKSTYFYPKPLSGLISCKL